LFKLYVLTKDVSVWTAPPAYWKFGGTYEVFAELMGIQLAPSKYTEFVIPAAAVVETDVMSYHVSPPVVS
jgi:hypothetical protein